MTVTVRGDCSIDVLAGALAERGQWLPIDIAQPGGTTVADLIGENRSGPLRASQGTVRDYLIGLRWRDRDGHLISSGGRVVKNVAGYDLAKMHIGARGVFGEIVEATFKVRPRPAREVAITFECASGREAAAAALAVRDLIEPAWCMVVCEAGRARVVVGVMGSERVVEAHGDAVMGRWPGIRAGEGALVRADLVARLTDPGRRARTVSMLAGDVGDYLDANDRRLLGTVVLADVLSGVVTVVASGDAVRVESPAPAASPGSVESRLRSALQAAFSTRGQSA
jgi:FAD/FMN-containing dehydrogenase